MSRSCRASPTCKAEAVHAVRSEMARTLDDVLSRRTRARLLARDDSAAAAEDAAALVGRELGWDDAERARQVKEYRAAVAAERDAADLPETALEDLTGAMERAPGSRRHRSRSVDAVADVRAHLSAPAVDRRRRDADAAAVARAPT